MKISNYITLIPLTLFIGCASVSERFEDKSVQVEQNWVNTMASDGEIDLSWSEAVDYLYENNNELIDGRQNIEFAEEEKRVAWKRLMPRPSVNLNYTKLIKEMDDTDWDDISSVADLFISFPNPFTFAESLYRSEYIYQQAVFDLEMKRRSLTAQLLTLYHAQEVLRYKELELEALRDLSSRVNEYEDDYEKARVAFEVERSDFHESMRELLGNEYVRFDFKESSDLPWLDYSTDNLEDPRLGLMYRRMAALEMVAMDLNVIGIQISRLPQFGIYTLAPPFYQSSNGDSSQIDFEDVRISTSVYFSYDTSGATKLSIERAKYMRDVQADRISEEMTNTFERFRVRQQEIKVAVDSLNEMDRVMAGLSAVEGEQVNRLKFQLEKQRAETILSLVTLQSKIWVMDEAAWEKNSQLALLAKK